MRALLRKELSTTYLDPEVHFDLTVTAKVERKPIREVLEAAVQRYIDTSPAKPAVEAAKAQASQQ